MKKVELLSPVGNQEMLYQAIHNYADAIYLSGKNYGARKYSTNFTIKELIEAIKYSHLYGVKVYVTINTIIYEEEIPDLIKYITTLYKNGIDALIMQDIGMIKKVKETFPDLEIHASTQCHVHNEEVIKFLKKIGCSRVVLAREMSLTDIKKIKTPIEKEIFIHGALCISYSGCCLFSSLNGGRSGNRGSCVGSCRLPYTLLKNNNPIKQEDKYLLSTKELNTINNLQEILDSHPTSLKIEGRMKSPYYVGYVTKLYHDLINDYYHHLPLKTTPEQIKNLKLLYNREFTKGYLFNDPDITNTKTPNHIGIPIGKVIKITKKYIYLKLSEELNQEDGIRFTNSNKGMIVNKIYNEKFLLTSKISPPNICLIENKINLKEKSTILKTTSKKLIDKLKNYSPKLINIDIEANFPIGKNYTITIFDGINKITESGPISEPAITREVTKENIENCINKFGNTPFILNKLTIKKDPNIFINLKSINETRRKLIAKLIKLRSNSQRTIPTPLISKENYQKSDHKYHLNVLTRTEEQLKCCIKNNINTIYVTDWNLYNKYKKLNNIYYRCPRVNNTYPTLNNENLLICELGSINKYQDNNKLISDYYLNVVNSNTIKLLNSYGVTQVTLSPELTKNQIKNIMQQDYNVELIVYGRLELMITKHCPLKKALNYCSNCKNNSSKFYLEDQLQNKYPLIQDNCLTHIMHYKNINLINNIPEYKKLNITNYRIELFDENYKETEFYIQKINNML